ncbi:rhomboid family intramembrane serine protease [Gracilibacillus dipsosauri]|uniref:rhomboid family intramembrane serine protease n=1 Tax=Gracilibacillus dipsosauri TaxID=178340 RepID=UPI00240A960C
MVLQLIQNENFDLISINKEQTEYLLERKRKNKKDVVHISMNQMDWKRELLSFNKHLENSYTKHQATTIWKKNIHFHHVYVVDYQPVDSWEELRETSSNRMKSSVYMLDIDSREEEIERLIRALDLALSFQIDVSEDLMELEQRNVNLKQNILFEHTKQQQQLQQLFKQGKPFWTYLLLAINIVMYILLEFNGGSTSTKNLIEFGAKYNVAIIDGEWWRLISSMFLHIGIAHILLNMFALYYIGTLVERIYGGTRFLIIYFIAGIVGGLASFALNPSIAAGASGAIFGLFGALLFFGSQYPKAFFRTMGWNIIIVIIINIIFGFSMPQIDNGAHIGGLIGGAIGAAVVMFKQRSKILWQTAALLLLLLVSGGIWFYGNANEEVQFDETLQVIHSHMLLEQEQYEKTYEVLTKAMPYADKLEAELRFNRSYASIFLNKNQEAITDLERTIEIKPEYHEALYNLALLYHEENRREEALDLLKKAVELAPNNQDYQQFYEQLQKGTI